MSEILLSNVLPTEETNTLQRIRSNALEHFAKYGYVGASVREITQAAKVTKPTLYYYFNNKEDLFRGLAASCFTKVTAALEESLNTATEFSDRFCALVEAYYTFCNKDFPAARFIKVVSAAPPRDIPNVGVEEFDQKISALMGQLASDAVAKKEIPESKKGSVELLLRGLFCIAVENRLKGEGIPLQNVRETLNSLLVRGS